MDTLIELATALQTMPADITAFIETLRDETYTLQLNGWTVWANQYPIGACLAVNGQLWRVEADGSGDAAFQLFVLVNLPRTSNG